MTLPRIVSLLPSATEIAVALGLSDQLVGRSHECDFPAPVTRLPICTATKLRKGLSSIEIEHRVQEIVRAGLSVYEVDTPLLQRLRPDVILTQSQCAVCAVTPRDLEEALATWIGQPPALLSLAPDNLTDVWEDFRRVGEATGRVAEADNAVAQLRERLSDLRERPQRSSARPTVLALEWIDPLMAAGNWIPELIEAAGGTPLLAAPGQHSPWISWQDIATADPDIIVMMPCGYQVPQTMVELRPLTGHREWKALRAVKSDRVYVADGHHFFNRPGPRLAESADIIAEILDSALGISVQEGDEWCKVLLR
jgi:iron complex transport system substrate-binding protein